MRVLVTGAGGFIGSHVVRALLASNHEVAALVRPGASRWRLEGLDQGVAYLEVALEDDLAVRVELGRWRPETCIHLAWFGEPGAYLTAPENIGCLLASIRLVEALAAAGCRHVVMAGTCAEYDTDLGFLREDGPTRPRTLYAASKLALSVVAAARAAQLGIGLTWARLFYLYGPYENERRLVPALITSQLDREPFVASAGTQVRDYLHVNDVAGALCAVADRGVDGAVNICSGEPITVRQLMSTVGAILGQEALIRFDALPVRDWDPPFIVGDNRRLRTETAWSSRYPLAQGLTATVEWWREQRRAERAA